MVKIADVKEGFWGITLDGNKRYSQTVQQSFHVSMAALDCREKAQGDSEGCVSVMLEHAGAEFLLCTLQRGRVYQQSLDLFFTEGEQITLFLVGKGTVHLTGFVDFGEPDHDHEHDHEDEDDDEFSSDEFEADHDSEDLASEELSDEAQHKGKAKAKPGKAAQAKYEDVHEIDSFDEDDDSEDSEADTPPPAKRPKPQLAGGDVKSKDKVAKVAKHDEGVGQTKPDQTSQKPSASQGTQVASKGSEEAAAASGSVEKKKKKKKKKKNKDAEAGDANPSSGSAPVAAVPKSPAAPTSGSQRKTLAGGVTVDDIKVGSGPEAKPGKMVHVYYVGQLSTGKTFDKKTSDKPFNFRLGKGEVIKGWDIGLQGMKVGGKRRITVPPHMGYGKEKAGSIPPNSTLTFEVELKAVN